MSLLLEDHLIKSCPRLDQAGNALPCWEALSCSKVLCPAYGREGMDCWLIPKTHCSNYLEDDFFNKLATCLTCGYFKRKGEIHPRGWNQFLSEQAHKYNVKSLEQLYQKEESFVEILDRIPDGLFTTDQEWRITYFNPAAEKITGFSAFDAVGMYCRDVFKNAICETDCALKRAVREGRDIHNREYLITTIDGRQIPIICSTSAFRDSAGRITGGLEIFKDITELKKLQEENMRREKKYRRIFEGSHDMIYTTNLQGKILDVNPAGVEMMGYRTRDALLEMGSVEGLYRHPGDREKFLKTMEREGFTKDFEVEFKRHNGSPIHVLISSRRYENLETGEIEFEGIIKDITRRQQAEEVLKQRNRELFLINSIAVALNLTTDLDHILSLTLRKVLKVLNLFRGGLFIVDPEEKRARLKVQHAFPGTDSDAAGTIFFKDKQLETFMIEKGVALNPEPIFPPFQVGYQYEGSKEILWLYCFLITLQGKALGFFGFDIPPTRVLSQHEIHLLGSLGNFLGGVIENNRLVGTIHKHRQELRRLTGKLFQSQEEERRRIARELHDEAGQLLAAVKLGLDRLEEKAFEKTDAQEEIREIRKMIVRASSEIRGLSYRLHPTLLSDLGLEPALNLYFKEIARHATLDIDFKMVGFDERLHPDVETVFYRFSQEALTNALKHSGAETFKLSLIRSYPKIIFLAEDDGVGFDGQIVGKDRRSLGLIGMRERAHLLGGTFQLRTRLGEGTRIRIEIPLPETHSDG